MFTVTERIRIERDREAVFAFFSDPAERPRWDTAVLSEELVTDPPARVGSLIRTTMRIMRRESVFVWRITRFDPPHGMAVTSESGAMPTASTWVFEDSGGACVATATIDASPEGMMRVVEPVIEATVRTSFREGLARAKVLLEGAV